MSSPKDSSTKWKILAAVFIVTTLIGFAATAYYYNGFTNANSKNSDLSATNSDLKNTVASDASQISSLNSQIGSLNGQITDLKSQVSVDQTQIDKLTAQIASLQDQVTTLQKQLAALPKVDWTTGTVTITSMTCGIFSTCNPVAIEFTDPFGGGLQSSVVTNGGYSLWLLDGVPYSPITVVYTSSVFGILISIKTCTPSPATFTPATNPASQSFSC